VSGVEAGVTARPLAAAALLLLSLSACSTRTNVATLVLPVPPLDSRWEISQNDRIVLPLTAAGRAELADALTWGLNRNNKIDNVAAGIDPNAPKKYAPLFDLLSSKTTLQALGIPPFKTWFPGPMVMQVVDARDPVTPRNHTPVALNDGAYWWVFYRDLQDQLIGVMPVKVNVLQVMDEKKH
jgi:hypothetical protein